MFYILREESLVIIKSIYFWKEPSIAEEGSHTGIVSFKRNAFNMT